MSGRARRSPRPEPRTLRGLAVAAGAGALVLLYLHEGRPWLASHGLSWHVAEDAMSFLKALLALSALALSFYERFRALRNRELPRRGVAGAFAAMAFLGGCAFLATDDLSPARYVHGWELFHYHLGSKYQRELGYKLIYACAAIAEGELGPAAHAEVRARRLRDLETDVAVPAGPVLDRPETCKSRFTPRRWQEFRGDVRFFRSTSSRGYWEDIQLDHGYNPPPLWTTIGHLLSSLEPLTEGSLKRLASLDPLLYVGTFFLVWWAFGARVMCVALIFFGTQFPANGFFTGGAFLRQDWLFWLVASACLVRKRYFALGGAALVASALLRIFPVVFFAGWAVVVVARWVRTRRLASEHRRLAAGCAVAAAVLLAASWVATGPSSYGDFYRHISLHHRTPLTNNMGLAQLLSYSPGGRMALTRDPRLQDPFSAWSRLQREHLAQRAPLRWGMVLIVCGAFVHVVRRLRTLWIAQALAVLLVVTLLQITCYYYAFFLLAPLLSRAVRWVERAVLLAGGASALAVVWPRLSYWWDERYLVQTVVFLALGVILLVAFMRPVGGAAARGRGTA